MPIPFTMLSKSHSAVIQTHLQFPLIVGVIVANKLYTAHSAMALACYHGLIY